MSASSDNKQQKAPSVNLSDAEWKEKLTAVQYRVLRQKGTEDAGSGEFNKKFETGTYTCAGCGEELYDSSSKFDSRCGWPAFSASLGTSVKHQINENGHCEEILCANCDGHLGHVFRRESTRDGNGKIVQERHCVNSVSLKFESKK